MTVETVEQDMNFKLPSGITNQRFPLTEAINAWNRLPYSSKLVTNTVSYKKEVKYYLLSKYKDFVCTKKKMFLLRDQ